MKTAYYMMTANSRGLLSRMDETPSIPQADIPPSLQRKFLVAPIWHTVLLVIVIVLVSFGGTKAASHGDTHGSKLFLYTWNIVWQFIIVGYIWFGLRLRHVRLRDLIGGRWNDFEAFLLDVVIAAAFWIVSALALAVLRFAMGTLPQAHDAGELKRTLGFLVPGTTQELILWMLVSLTAGFCEEIIFRGYLQQQFRLLTNSALFGIIASGLLFGGGHGYQGPRMMIVLAVYGMMFGALAQWRRSLRPGMIAHAWQDAITGVVSRVLLR